jgi:hypothetical protein
MLTPKCHFDFVTPVTQVLKVTPYCQVERSRGLLDTNNT